MTVSIGKWTKYTLMKEEKKLSTFLPETQLFGRKALWEFLEKYNHIIFKPGMGGQGKGIIQVSLLEGNVYEVHEAISKIKVYDKTGVFEYLMERRRKKGPHIIQQKIELAAINNNPFDIRIMVQRIDCSTPWEITGRLAKVAADGFFITNAAKEIMSVEKALSISLASEKSLQDIIAKIDEAALLTAKHLEQYYPERHIMGIDLGLDTQGSIWIIEVNSYPSIILFNRLEDKSMFETIKRYLRKAR